VTQEGRTLDDWRDLAGQQNIMKMMTTIMIFNKQQRGSERKYRRRNIESTTPNSKFLFSFGVFLLPMAPTPSSAADYSRRKSVEARGNDTDTAPPPEGRIVPCSCLMSQTKRMKNHCPYPRKRVKERSQQAQNIDSGKFT